MSFTESNYENALKELFTRTLGYSAFYGPDIVRDCHLPLYEDELLPALQAVNPGLPRTALDDAVYRLKNFASGSLLQKNRVFTDYLQNGVPVKYLEQDEETLRLIDQEYDLMDEDADPVVIAKSKKQLGQLESILGHDQTIASLVDDILHHYENYRAHLLTGKAMIVAYSRPIAMKIYRRILQLRPDWQEKVGVVMSQDNKDPEEWRAVIGNKAHREDMARKFKDNSSPLKIAIVVDMWLTGFDVPSLATMYVYKPMSGHNLMQAIARVNRVFQDKYPPEGMEDAVNTVISQCELWTDEASA